jgi:hypothetical protein
MITGFLIAWAVLGLLMACLIARHIDTSEASKVSVEKTTLAFILCGPVLHIVIIGILFYVLILNPLWDFVLNPLINSLDSNIPVKIAKWINK